VTASARVAVIQSLLPLFRSMAGTFGGYGLPLHGFLPAEMLGEPRFALSDENTLAPAQHDAPQDDGTQDVVRDGKLIKVSGSVHNCNLVAAFEQGTRGKGPQSFH
jgi:hypothetical protein